MPSLSFASLGMLEIRAALHEHRSGAPTASSLEDASGYARGGVTVRRVFSSPEDLPSIQCAVRGP